MCMKYPTVVSSAPRNSSPRHPRLGNPRAEGDLESAGPRLRTSRLSCVAALRLPPTAPFLSSAAERQVPQRLPPPPPPAPAALPGQGGGGERRCAGAPSPQPQALPSEHWDISEDRKRGYGGGTTAELSRRALHGRGRGGGSLPASGVWGH